jgi:hypothetical protein
VEEVRLERLAVEVPDLDGWVDRFESVLGPGFRRHSVRQATGAVDVAIHPAGAELLAKPDGEPRLRSFHLRSSGLEQTLKRAREAGWRELDAFHADGRRHVVFDVGGLRLVILEAG